MGAQVRHLESICWAPIMYSYFCSIMISQDWSVNYPMPTYLGKCQRPTRKTFYPFAFVINVHNYVMEVVKLDEVI